MYVYGFGVCRDSIWCVSEGRRRRTDGRVAIFFGGVPFFLSSFFPQMLLLLDDLAIDE